MTLHNTAAAEFEVAVFGGGDVGEGIVGTRESSIDIDEFFFYKTITLGLY